MCPLSLRLSYEENQKITMRKRVYAKYYRVSQKINKHLYTSIILHIFLGPHKNVECDEKVRRLVDMGIEEHQARVALSSYNWELERATEQLFS